MLLKSLTVAVLYGSLAAATPKPSRVDIRAPQASSTITPGGPACGQNGPTNRACWKNVWNISTDYETTTPPGTTRNIDLFITNVTSFSADGVTKRAMLINGMMPSYNSYEIYAYMWPSRWFPWTCYHCQYVLLISLPCIFTE
jgi:hypothetical protein